MHAFILAGGFATRLWPLTEKRAKPLLPLAGKPILTHIVEKIPADIPVTVSTNAAFAEGFEGWKQSLKRTGITIVIEQTTRGHQKPGTNAALAQWLKACHLQEDLLLIAGDNYLGFSMDAFFAARTPKRPLLAAYDIGDREKATSFGIVLLDHSSSSPNTNPSTVLSFEEKPREPTSTIVSTGCTIIPACHLPIIIGYAQDHPDNIGGIFEEFLHRDIAIDCFMFSEPWFDIGSFEAYLEATKILVGDTILPGKHASLHDTVCEGSVVIGTGCLVQSSTLRDTVLFDDCSIIDCILDRCIVDNGCRLQGIDLTGKMLREGTVLKKG